MKIQKRKSKDNSQKTKVKYLPEKSVSYYSKEKMKSN